MSYEKPLKYSKVKYPITQVDYFHGGDKKIRKLEEVGRWNLPELWDLIHHIHPDSVLLTREVVIVEERVPTHQLHAIVKNPNTPIESIEQE